MRREIRVTTTKTARDREWEKESIQENLEILQMKLHEENETEEFVSI